MKYWHRIKAWLVMRRIRKEHHELAKYVRRSAHEINAWKQDIRFLEELLDYHQSRAGKAPAEFPASGKVVPMESADSGPRPAVRPGSHVA